MNNDDEFVYANAKIRNEEKLLLVQKYHLKHENNAWYSERENSHKHLIFRDDFFERADLIGLLFRINKLCIAKVKYFRQNIGKYEPLKYDYKRGFISVPLWDAEFLKHRDSGLILDFRYLQTITVYDDFIRLCRELDEFEPGDDSDGIVVYPEQKAFEVAGKDIWI